MASTTQATALNFTSVIQFLQAESSRYERDRNYWELERAEMKARIAKLEGERKSNERMKDWSQKRLSMVEAALQKERSKKDAEPESSEGVTTDPHVGRKAKSASRHLVEFDEQFKEIVRDSQASLRDQTGRTKARAYLEKCLMEVTYLVNSHPSISANIQPTALDSTTQFGSVLPDDNVDKPSFVSGPRPLKDRPTSPPAIPIRRNASPAPSADQSDQPSHTSSNGFVKMYEVNPEPVPLDEIALEDNEQIERVTHVYDFRGQFVGLQGEVPEIEPSVSEQKNSNEEDLKFSETSEKRTDDDSWDFGATDTLQSDGEAGYRTRQILQGPSAKIRALQCVQYADTAWTVSAGDDGCVRIHKGSEPMPVITLESDSGAINSIACIEVSGNLYIYAGGEDMVIRKWAVRLDSQEQENDPFQPIQMFVSHSQSVLALELMGDNMLSASADGSIRKWDIDSGESLTSWWPQEDNMSINPTSICPCAGDAFAVGYTDGHIALYQLNQPSSRLVIRNSKETPARPASCINVVKYLKQETRSLLISAHEDHHIRIYDYTARVWMSSILAHQTAVTSMCILPHDRIVTAAYDNLLKIWSTSGDCLQDLIITHPDGKEDICAVSHVVAGGVSMLVTGGSAGTLTICDRQG